MKNAVAVAFGVFGAILSAVPAGATCGGGGGGGRGGMAPRGDVAEQVYQVPWTLLKPGDAPPSSHGLVLYWFPASVQEFKDSSMRTSRDLTLLSAQCVTMAIADAGSPLGAKLDAAKAPVAVLTDGSGAVIGRVDGEQGKLKAADVEKLLRAEMKKREDLVDQQWGDARAKSKSGDSAGAIAAYQSVWEARCLFPKRAKDAAKELKKLGAPVPEEKSSALVPFAPAFDGPRAAEVVATMTRGLTAELAGRYEDARSLYARAARLDSDDPTPRRYLGELYRHHIGDWKQARRVFEEMLARPIDPLSRAVALHGIGKMTIHEGAFEKGRSLMEESVAAYATPLAYRNLAVYWNSEGDAEKTARYVGLALELDPDDAYNRIFAAVFWAQTGRTAEALQIAKDNEGLLPASYNLAAIYAQAGQKERALGFLKRHFYEYERYGAVRGEEMMEARVDAVFASMRKDPEFLALTALADGKLQMPMMTAH
jgi:tetratricopeptide (TPR) repeat protein